MPKLGVTTTTTLTLPLGVLAVAEDLRDALLTLRTVEVEGADGTPAAYAHDADYSDRPGTPRPYRAVERALFTVLAEATGSEEHARRVLDEAAASGETIRYAIEEVLGWRVVVTDGAGNPLPGADEEEHEVADGGAGGLQGSEGGATDAGGGDAEHAARVSARRA